VALEECEDPVKARGGDGGKMHGWREARRKLLRKVPGSQATGNVDGHWTALDLAGTRVWMIKEQGFA
jgi:hypothetical protein